MTAPNEIFDFSYFNSLHAKLEKCESEEEAIIRLEYEYSEFVYGENALPWLKLMLYHFVYDDSYNFMYGLTSGYKNKIITALLDWEVTAQRLEDRKNNATKPAAINCLKSTQELKEKFPLLKKGKYIHPSTTEAQFLATFKTDVLPENRVKWTGSKKKCFSCMLDVLGEEIKPGEIKKHFIQYAIDPKTNMPNTSDLISRDRSNCKRGFWESLK